MAEQGTIGWFRNRLGKLNGSEVGDLMGVPKTKGKQWTDTAQKLLCKVAAERHLSFLADIDDEFLEGFLKRCGAETQAIKWGHTNEPFAVIEFNEWYNKNVGKKHTIQEAGSVVHPKLDFFAASPDRILEVEESDGTTSRYVVEVKCPYIPANAFMAMKTVYDWESLKKWNSGYYWQVVAEIACNSAKGAYFVIYDPHQEVTASVTFLERDEEAEIQLINRVIDANEYIKNIML